MYTVNIQYSEKKILSNMLTRNKHDGTIINIGQ